MVEFSMRESSFLNIILRSSLKIFNIPHFNQIKVFEYFSISSISFLNYLNFSKTLNVNFIIIYNHDYHIIYNYDITRRIASNIWSLASQYNKLGGSVKLLIRNIHNSLNPKNELCIYDSHKLLWV